MFDVWLNYYFTLARSLAEKCGLCERKRPLNGGLFHSHGGGFPHEPLFQDAPCVDAGSDLCRRRGEAVAVVRHLRCGTCGESLCVTRCGEAVALVKHCGLGGFPHEQMLKGFPDLSKGTNRTMRGGRSPTP